MILTGDHISKSVHNGDITLSPFSQSQVNPNSYNYRLGPKLKMYSHNSKKNGVFTEIDMPNSGYILKSKTLYLGHTHEIIGSRKYAMSLIGRSSIGRLGLFIQISANLGHTNACHQWTLEIYPTISIRVYPGMVLGQVSFWGNRGEIQPYCGKYGAHHLPQESLITQL